VALPAPFAGRNGPYQVEEIHPTTSLTGDDGQVALRCPVVLRETDNIIYAWDAATEEQDVVVESFDPTRNRIAMPGVIGAQTGPGVDLDTGGTIIPRILLDFAASTSAGVQFYDWEFREDAGEWQTGGSIIATAAPFVFTGPVGILVEYDFRVRARIGGATSLYRELLGVVVGLAVSGTTAAAEPAQARFTGTAPISPNFAGVRIYRTTGATFTSPVLEEATITVAPGDAFDVVADAVPLGQAYYWIVPVSLTGTEGTPDGPHDLTITA
jgi:hypothetical protein